MTQMEYKKYNPPLALQPYVRYFWSFDSSQPEIPVFIIKSFADKHPRLIFQNLLDFDSIRTAQGEKMPLCYLSGIDTKDTVALVGGSFSHFGVSFYPHALNAIFRIGAHELINEMPDVSLVCNSGIQFRLESAKTHLDRVHILSKYLFDKIADFESAQSLVNHIILSQAITEDTPMNELQKAYDISERQLERKFKTTVGISPKKYQRIIRFEKSLQLLMSADYTSLASLAHRLNYTDQSHFIKDFKAFSGMTPYEFINREKFGSESSSFIYA